MSASDATLASRNRVKLLLLIGLFMLPPIAAWVAWQMIGDQGGQATSNAGTLVSPARPLANAGLYDGGGNTVGDDILRGHWTYVLFAGDGCDGRCKEQLYITRQVRLSVNKDMPRVARLLLLSEPPDDALRDHLLKEHEDLRWAVIGNGADALTAAFSGPGFGMSGAQFFLVDPLGNLMMSYTLDVQAKGIMGDLRKLLKVSQIG